jgi:GTPase SAR1 family protein
MNLNPLKILFSGLANAGKTSILKVLDNNIEEIESLTPTHGVQHSDYKVMGLTAVVWDMGGQNSYRYRYLAEFEKYFQGTSVLFYVIDVQAEKEYEETAEFLKAIVAGLQKLQVEDIFIPVLYHKYDPHIQTRKFEWERKLEPLRVKIEKILRKTPHAYFETSIYEPYTIFRAFSKGLLHQVTQAEVISQKMQEIAEEFGSQGAAMLAAGGYTYGAWHSTEVQLLDLVKFDRIINDYARVLSDGRYSDYVVMPLSETADIAAITFAHEDRIVTFCIMAPATRNSDEFRQNILNKQRELNQVLDIIGSNER